MCDLVGRRTLPQMDLASSCAIQNLAGSAVRRLGMDGCRFGTAFSGLLAMPPTPVTGPVRVSGPRGTGWLGLRGHSRNSSPKTDGYPSALPQITITANGHARVRRIRPARQRPAIAAATQHIFTDSGLEVAARAGR